MAQSKGLPRIKPENWAEIKKLAGGSRHEYTIFPSGTTPDFFEKNTDLLIEKLEEWTNFADPLEIVATTNPAADGLTSIERVALLVLHAVFPESRTARKSADHIT